MTRGLRTDFEEYGLTQGSYPIAGRFLLLTVDFEAFDSELIPLWLEAMRHWAVRAKASRVPCCFFLSVEDAIRLRATNRMGYETFLDAMKALEDAGSLFYPHNHFVFDAVTGEKKPLPHEPEDLPAGYAKRKSLFYDAVYRHRLDFASWSTAVRDSYEEVLSDAGCRKPTLPVFRAGGWDYGSSCRDLPRYIEGLVAAGFRADSSACRGIFETPTWRIGSDFGANIFWLDKGLLEIAPTWSMDISGRPLFPGSLRNLLSLRRQWRLWTGQLGAFVAVLHFDHLFRRWVKGSPESLALREMETVRKRIDRLFQRIVFIRSILGLTCATFEDIELGERLPR